MRFLALLIAVYMSLSCFDAEAKIRSKRHIKLKKKQALLKQPRLTPNPNAYAPAFVEPELPLPAPEPVLVVEEPVLQPQPEPVAAEEKQEYSTFGFLTSINLMMHHLRGTDSLGLPFKLTSGIGFGIGAEGSYNFMDNAGAFIRFGLDTASYKDPDSFAITADKKILYNGNIGVRLGQNYVVGGEIYYGFMQNLYYFSRTNTDGFLERASTNLLGFKANVKAYRSDDYELLFGLGGKYIFKRTKGSFSASGYTIDTDIDFKIAVSEKLFMLTGFTFEYRKASPSTCKYSEYFGMLKLGFGRK